MSNSCENFVTQNGWTITLNPTLSPSNTFHYEITPKAGIKGRNVESFIFCLCEDLIDLLDIDNCSWIVSFQKHESEDSTKHKDENTILIENNSCKGIKFDFSNPTILPQGNSPNENITKIDLVITFNESLTIGSINVTFKTKDGNSNLWENVCGPECSSPTRGILLK